MVTGPAVQCQSVWFEEISIGTQLPSREFGPVTITDTVMWAGVQENPWRLHFDRQYVRDHYGLPTVIASGQYREALLTRWLIEWSGPLSTLRRLSLRQKRPTFEGDMIRYTGDVVAASDTTPGLVTVDLVGTNQEQVQILTAQALVDIPRRVMLKTDPQK